MEVMAYKKGISSFSVLLLSAVAAVVGIACLSILKVQYVPTNTSRTIRVSYSYPGASARIVEQEVTSQIEGVLSTIKDVTGISSLSNDGSGSVSIEVGRHSDLQTVRFEVASQIRNLYSHLPEGCTYPAISLNSSGQQAQTAISFSIRSPLPSVEIAHFVESTLLHPISVIEGVSSVEFYGQTPFEWVITLDDQKLTSLGISSESVASAISSYYSEALTGISQNNGSTYAVKLRNITSNDLSDAPVANLSGRVVHLGDIATFRYQEALPNSYYRINGLNVLNLTVEASPEANLISLVQDVKDCIASMNEVIPDEIGISVGYDYSEYISDELDKIIERTLLCLLILLAFAFAVSRSWRYMAVIGITLAVNLAVSAACYLLTGLHIHIYTLAGITVSLGIIIDNSIVMVDHYSRTGTRSVFPALLSAVLTTVASLLAIFLLPESEKANLTDFSLVIIINLTVSLLVSYLFVPALLEYFPVKLADGVVRTGRLRRIAHWNGIYSRYIGWAVRHRWVLLLALAAMGLTYLPFDDAMERSDFYREPARQELYIRAGMMEGSTIHQLNEVMKSMENYLAQIEEIDVFETRITSYESGTISVLFKPEVENTWLPLKIKSDVIDMAMNFGGANWSVSGLDDSYFSNRIVTDTRSYEIPLTGYNYDELLSYGDSLIAHLSANRRIVDAEIWGTGSSNRPRTEFNLSYDFESLAMMGIRPRDYFNAIQSPLYEASVFSLPYNGTYSNVRLESSARETFDVWHLSNQSVSVGETRAKLSDIGSITKKKTGLSIEKVDQAYNISVRLNVIGSYQIAEKLITESVDYINDNVLPIGFTAKFERNSWYHEHKNQYIWLVLLVVAMIFVISATHFNSLRYSLGIILLIPTSFIGVFLSFGLTDFVFDKGGFAAFVMLSGITVNAGIYLVSEWLHETSLRRSSIQRYVRAFNHKIIPISLTILSTMLGLVPFLFDGPKEVFWFPFAIGTISGLCFSVIALVFFLPAFILPSNYRSFRQASRKRAI